MTINLQFKSLPGFTYDVNFNQQRLGFKLGGREPFMLIAGPCVLEPGELGMAMHLEVATELARIKKDLGLEVIFKASFDKANRTSIKSFRGLDWPQAAQIFKNIRTQFNLPVITDVHDTEQIQQVADHVDILQIPAFLCRQTDLVLAAAQTGKPVMIKKGQFLAPHDMGGVVEKFISTGNSQLILCERGTCFGYNRLINDMGGLEEMRHYGVPICFDATHSVQEPGAAKSHSSGHPEQIPALARAAVAVGIDALFLETHPRPQQAMSDASTVFPLAQLYELISNLLPIDRHIKK